MSSRFLFASLTRISDLDGQAFSLKKLPQEQWDAGDYVAGEIFHSEGCHRNLEFRNGRMIEVDDGDLIVGAFGTRAATLEAVGDWQAIGNDLRFDMLTAAGLFGRLTSKSPYLKPPMRLDYKGHVTIDGLKRNMSEYIGLPGKKRFEIPVILIIGTSMSAGKTTAGRIIVRRLKERGLKVIGAKMTGAGRYRDVLSFGDAGADAIFDFVDVGLPSTVWSEEAFRQRTRLLLSKMAAEGADVIVAEAGASPLEPYNGAIAIDELKNHVRFTLLCASDPYAVIGVTTAFNRKPDLVSGGAANTEAGIRLVKKLTGIDALNLLGKKAIPVLDRLLEKALRGQTDRSTM